MEYGMTVQKWLSRFSSARRWKEEEEEEEEEEERGKNNNNQQEEVEATLYRIRWDAM